MVESSKDSFGAPAGQCVIERRGAVQEYERGAVHTAGDHMDRRASLGGEDHHEDQRRDAEQQAGPMGQAVGHFFGDRKCLVGILMRHGSPTGRARGTPGRKH